MSIRRFVGATAREALRQARESLGDDAMILANRTVEGGVEVLALNETGLAELETGSRPAPMAGAAALGGEVMQALGALRGAVETRIDGLLWGERLRRAPVGVTVYRTLLGAGFSAALARALSERVPAELDREAALEWARRELVLKLPVQHDDEALWGNGGVFALVGPTGVGKTTTTAKLAARCVLKFGAERVAMLTTDGYRIGAHEQLLIYGRILGVPVLPAGDAAALREALGELRGKHVILVDTVGMSQRDRQVAEQAAMLCGAGRQVRRLLVLNAASQGDTLDEVAHAYRQDNAGAPLGCVVSKVDEATHLGAVLDTAIRHRLPIHYVSNGQKVPENLAHPNAAKLVDRALAMAAARSLFAPSEADFAVLRSVDNEPGEPRPAPAPAPAVELAPPSPHAARYRRHLRMAVAVGVARGGQQVFDQALHQLKDDRAFSLAQQLWRHYAAGDTDLALATDTVLADVRAHLGQTCRRHVLVWHAAGRMLPGGISLAPSALLSDRGEALAVPVCHVPTPQGILTTQHETPSLPAGEKHTALARAGWLDGQLGDAALVHGYEGLGLAAMARLLASGTSWMARCTDPQRVIHQGHTLTVKGLAGSLGYLPAGDWEDGQTLWVAVAPVALPRRAARDADGGLRLVVTRLVDRTTGSCRSQIHTLVSMPEFVEPTTLGRWAAWMHACRQLRPWLDAAERRLALGAEAHESLPSRLLPAAQLALAGWQAQRRPDSPVANVLGLAGTVTRPETVIDALLRLLAALELTLEAA
ncbi:MAG: flagellar biosynthesis protein FlhF [Pigmentiphaga sp.]|nr:flagellar biosynthesis protein FlhF [Pigmentiphaga sp.]